MDVQRAVTVPYVAAVKTKSKSISEKIPLYVDDIVDFILFLILSVGVWIKTIKNLFNPKSPKNISGQLALVTGGGHGLGREIAIRLAKEGCNIAIADLDIAAATETATIIKAFKVEAKAFSCDVSKYEEVRNLARDIERDLGPVDILINNAGIMPKFSLLEGKSSDLENILDVNIKSHLWTVRVFLESMIRRNKGHIVGISSLAGLTGLGRQITYTATKYAVRGFMEALSDELRLDKYDYIKLSTVYPTYLSTRQDLMDVVTKTERFKRSAMITPESAANTIVEGILVDKKSITIPKCASCFIGFFSLLPAEITHLYNDIVQKSNLPRIEL